ncbi:MAG: Rieske 2Fe-2S domain-containing protein [Ktedonobacteraceae bacterium]|nr:Rieske 2Fe-2S domain-containing protein [Ktedonobacteraceae bacterium]MBO0790643.1 Rieske 2Fe-2S domain-containing protein [Ktedonobacteraceae bacterium]
MPGEDQERFEDYLELERYIEGLQEEHRVSPPRNLTPAQARIYRMAALFHSATPGASEPSPEFVAALYKRLLALGDEGELNELDEPTEKLPIVQRQEIRQEEVSGQPRLDEESGSATRRPREPEKPRTDRRHVLARLSRRRLIAGGAVAAASMAVGTGLGAALKPTTPPSQGNAAPPAYSIPLVPSGPGIPTALHYVTTLEQLGKKAVQFSAGGVIGYVILNEGDNPRFPKEKFPVIAFSAACTHMGCIVQWQDADRRFQCHCHGGVFDEYGQPSTNNKWRYTALPPLTTYITDGKIYVEVPKIDT